LCLVVGTNKGNVMAETVVANDRAAPLLHYTLHTVDGSSMERGITAAPTWSWHSR
jgi:hypothetical protein